MSKKILHIIKTVSIDNDGRLQKWIKFLGSGGYESDVFILQDDNVEGIVNEYDARIEKTSLLFRKWFAKRKGYAFKIPEYLIKFLRFIKRKKEPYDIIIFHDVQQYLNLAVYLMFCNPKSKVIWDLHELPHSITYKLSFSKRIIGKVLSSLDCIVYTNEERRDFMKKKFRFVEKKFTILNNYPDKVFNITPFQPLPDKVKVWLNGEKYILWLGVTNRARNFQTFFQVYKDYYLEEFKLIIIGKVDGEFLDQVSDLKQKGRVFNNYVHQNEIINYIDSAYFSVVLYNASSPNNFYCEPNRLYQLINRSVPIIVGHNPTMKSIVESQDIGVVLPDDGSSYELMHEGIQKLLNNYKDYKRSLLSSSYKNTNNVDFQFIEVIKKIKSL